MNKYLFPKPRSDRLLNAYLFFPIKILFNVKYSFLLL